MNSYDERINIVSHRMWTVLQEAARNQELESDHEELAVIVSLMVNACLGMPTKEQALGLLEELYVHAQEIIGKQWLDSQEWLRQGQGKPS